MLDQQLTPRRIALPLLASFHILIIASSNYLVQIPFQLFSVTITWGTFTFPLVYLATDMTVRLYGAHLARRIVAVVMAPALLLSYGVSVLFKDGSYMGMASLLVFNGVVARIAFASFSAYVIGQLTDVLVFNRLRRSPHWWLAPAASSIFGNLIDSISFFSIAFYRSTDAFMAEHWLSIGIADYGYKVLVCVVLILPAYGVLLNLLTRHLTHRNP
ncbi:Queuosine precursor transporter [BD1-7 clade bacterium]|uniref:Probable queuosine precursor transporter n=1 Tax=BD1-7 clade bacterium TaxID=2029982 RepID=A0A5S9PHZ4_9GAMM|nr:Queuosine precursor transporter [BD1-7 clade bacterium]